MNQTEQEKHQALYNKVVAKAWGDPAFKETLLTNPHAALAAAGVPVAAGKTVKVVENTDQIVYLVLPQRPAGELSDADLERAAGGTTHDLVPAV